MTLAPVRASGGAGADASGRLAVPEPVRAGSESGGRHAAAGPLRACWAAERLRAARAIRDAWIAAGRATPRKGHR